MANDLDDAAEFQEVKNGIAAEQAAIQVVKGAVAEVGFRTVARAKARLESYERVANNYGKYIEEQAQRLASNLYSDVPYKELGIARLVAAWIVESEAFFKEAEPLLTHSEAAMRRGYLEQSFEHLPGDIKARLLTEFAIKKQDLLVWFVQRVQEAGADVPPITPDDGTEDLAS